MFPDFTSTTFLPGISTQTHPWTVPQRRYRPCFIPSVGNGIIGMGKHTPVTQTQRSAPTATSGNKHPSLSSCSFLLTLFPSLQPAWNAPGSLGACPGTQGKAANPLVCKEGREGTTPPQAALGASERTRAQNPKKQRCQNSPPGGCSRQDTSDPCSKHSPLLHGVTLQLVRGHQLLTVGLRGSKQGSRAVLPTVPTPGWPQH